jgi:hypothetical protein
LSQQYSSQPIYSSSYTQQYQRYPSSSQYMRSYQPQYQPQQQQFSYQKQYFVPYQQQQQQQPSSYQQQRISSRSSPVSLFSPISTPQQGRQQQSYYWPQTQSIRI